MRIPTVILDGIDMKANKLVFPRKKTKTNTANKLTEQIIKFLELNRCQAERVNNISRQVNGRWVKSRMTRGTSDIHAIVRGRAVKIEVKIGKDRQSEYQKIYQRQVEEAGGVYYIAKDFNEFRFWFNQKFRNVCQTTRQ